MLTSTNYFGKWFQGQRRWLWEAPSLFTSILHGWPQSHYSVTLGPDRLALDDCKSKSGTELLLLFPGGPKDSESSGLALAQLARLPSLSSALQPVPLATWPQPLLQWQLCWAQGVEPDFSKDGSRHLGWKRETAKVELGPCRGSISESLSPREQPSSDQLLVNTLDMG